MVAVQETIRIRSGDKEACGPQRATNQGVGPISLRIREASYTGIPTRGCDVRRIGLNIVRSLEHGQWQSRHDPESQGR
jgi:hypothetical protein